MACLEVAFAAIGVGRGADPGISLILLMKMPARHRQHHEDRNHETDDEPALHARSPCAPGHEAGKSRDQVYHACTQVQCFFPWSNHRRAPAKTCAPPLT